jgi:L-arabinokinase
MPTPPRGRVVLYASDHGFGHAARMLALASHLAAAGYPVTLCAGAALAMAQAALPHLPAGIDLAHASLDPGLVSQPGALAFDLERSRERISAWLADLPRLISAESARLAHLGASLVIADAPAVAIAAAHEASVPAVVLSNFNWLDMYAGRFGAAVDDALTAAYAKAALGVRPLPGRLPLAGLPRIRDIDGAVARKPRRSRAEVRRELGVPDECLLVSIALGAAFAADLPARLAQACTDEDVRFIVPSPSARAGEGRLVFFPSVTPDPQDYLGAADLVLAKGGYSTLAEAALAGVPLAVFPLPGSPESAQLAADVASLGLGLSLRDEAEATAALASPRSLVDRARAAHRGPLPDAGPAFLQILLEEGLLRAP